MTPRDSINARAREVVLRPLGQNLLDLCGRLTVRLPDDLVGKVTFQTSVEILSTDMICARLTWGFLRAGIAVDLDAFFDEETFFRTVVDRARKKLGEWEADACG